MCKTLHPFLVGRTRLLLEFLNGSDSNAGHLRNEPQTIDACDRQDSDTSTAAKTSTMIGGKTMKWMEIDIAGQQRRARLRGVTATAAASGLLRLMPPRRFLPATSGLQLVLRRQPTIRPSGTAAARGSEFHSCGRSEAVKIMLLDDTFHVETFLSWWSVSRISNDFSLSEHVTPRKSFFDPAKWETP